MKYDYEGKLVDIMNDQGQDIQKKKRENRILKRAVNKAIKEINSPFGSNHYRIRNALETLTKCKDSLKKG